jgi:hypothetical protein
MKFLHVEKKTSWKKIIGLKFLVLLGEKNCPKSSQLLAI